MVGYNSCLLARSHTCSRQVKQTVKFTKLSLVLERRLCFGEYAYRNSSVWETETWIRNVAFTRCPFFSLSLQWSPYFCWSHWCHNWNFTRFFSCLIYVLHSETFSWAFTRAWRLLCGLGMVKLFKYNANDFRYQYTVTFDRF